VLILCPTSSLSFSKSGQVSVTSKASPDQCHKNVEINSKRVLLSGNTPHFSYPALFFSITTSPQLTCYVFTYLFIHYHTHTHTLAEAPSQDGTLFCSILNSPCIEQCLTHSRNSVNKLPLLRHLVCVRLYIYDNHSTTNF
jgi:hypothetical protein